MKLSFKIILSLILLAGILLGLPRLFTAVYSRSKTFSVANVPAARVAIVFGAGLWRNGTPTPVLQDRIATAAELYFSGKVEKLLLSGDNRTLDYNEPGAMKQYAIKIGVPEEALVLDYAGRSTYDTCYRAGSIFGLKEAILVTQQFHLPRAIYTCNRLGISVTGVKADRRDYSRMPSFYWSLREIPATLAAVWELNISHPRPVLGNPEPIFTN